MTDNAKAARNKKISHAIMMVILIIAFIAFVFPFILVVINVFKTKGDINSAPLALVGSHGFTLENFPNAIKDEFLELLQKFTDYHSQCDCTYHAVFFYGSVRDCPQQMESVFTSVFRNDRFHGYSVPGTDDPARIPVRRHYSGPEQQNHPDSDACWIFSFHGNVYVPRRNRHEYPAGA